MNGFLLNSYIFTADAPVAGYVFGGVGPLSSVERLQFSNDAISTISATLSAGRQGVTASESIANAYIAGGSAASVFVSTVDKMQFSSQTISNLSGSALSAIKDLMAGFSSNLYGYFAGGRTNTFGGTTAVIERIQFSNDARTNIAATLTQTRGEIGAGFNSAVAGYAAGGQYVGPTRVSFVDKLLFSNESVSRLGTGLSSNRAWLAGFESDLFGYAAGGNTGSFQSTVDKFAFSNDARTTLGTGLSSARGLAAGFRSQINGYVLGGYTGSVVLTTVDKFAFSNDARSTLGTGLTTARWQFSGTQG
jgi:hypothetical protein